MGLVDVQESSCLTVMLETLAKMHCEKIKTGQATYDFNDP